MSRHQNDEGEYLMTASEMRLEDELDDMARDEPDDFDPADYEGWD